jgi:hypothetical protein
MARSGPLLTEAQWITPEARRVSTTLRHMRREFIEFYFLRWAVC